MSIVVEYSGLRVLTTSWTIVCPKEELRVCVLHFARQGGVMAAVKLFASFDEVLAAVAESGKVCDLRRFQEET